ncbi:MAG: DNA primase [Desulfovibrionaceae bacterium]|nr:DNA primase [Desulfovibrionaceae bacterium]
MNSRNTDAIQAIKARIGIADLARRYVEVRPVGSRLVAPCPFHQETKPSFSINEEQGTFYCFGCQASGDIFDFYGRINGLDFRETLEQLAEEAGVQLNSYRPDPETARHRSQKRDMLKMHEVAAAHFIRNMRDSRGKLCRDYIAERGLSPDIQEKFGLGWSLDEWQDLERVLHRVGFSGEGAVSCGLLSRASSGRPYDRFRKRLMFPIRNLSGQVVAFGGRILPALAEENDAKYINSSDSPIYKKGEHLYGLFQARPSITTAKNVMLTEGYMDVLTLHQFGYTQAVGVLGTALTPEQVKRLSGFSSNIELLFDGDAAGRKAALRSCEMLLLRGLSCRVVLFPDPHDIDSLLRTEGPEAFESLRRDASDGMSFCLNVLRTMSPRDAVDWARNFLAQVELPELFKHFASNLAAGLGLTEAELRSAVLERKNQRHAAAAMAPAAPKVRDVSRDREIMTFAVRYPHRLPDLRDYGADLALAAPWARKLWAKLERYCRDECPEAVFSELEPKEKLFWVRCRDADAGAPALTGESVELDAIQQMLDTLQTTSHTASVVAALRQGQADRETQREYMRALKEARGRRGD